MQKIKSTASPCFLVCVECWGICPKPGRKGLFVKSPLESQKLRQNEVVYSRGSSLVYLSFKKGKKRRFGTQFQLFTTN